jgi:hypothetical protein
MHWDPVVRQTDFNPTTRWHDWRPARQDRFLWLAGVGLKQLGYPAQRRCRSGLSWRIRNSFLDLVWHVRRLEGRSVDQTTGRTHALTSARPGATDR